MIILFAKEFLAFFDSLIAYLAVGVFLLATGVFMWVLPNENVLDYGFATMDSLFTNAPYLLMFLTSAITMRSIAEEKKSGTLEWLFTKPISEWQIVTAKFLAAFAISLICLLPTWVYFISVYQLGNPVGNVDVAGTIGSYIGIVLLCMVFTSVGIFSSSVSDNQVVAFIMALVINYLIYAGFDALSGVFTATYLSQVVQYAGVAIHYEPLSRGLIDSRDVLYFASFSVFFLISTQRVLLAYKG